MNKRQSLERKIIIHTEIQLYLSANIAFRKMIKHSDLTDQKSTINDVDVFYERLDFLYMIFAIADELYLSGIHSRNELMQQLKAKISAYIQSVNKNQSVSDVHDYVDKNINKVLYNFEFH